ncbi:hypothetical protein SAMN05444166_0622 [Singulisphaera sp. GP187]|uniref:hypothetical protein n=1 Tax=Singulisphaera sp. GP187 TaxID=1882752 RepID=UPI00092AA2FC|nr:hypothetical protein [Singulisphaera sp. GP187]SIN74936.1 hypothetical protein SAMN05444166_0622 [Singulisphaera sp. GP187]
MPSQPPPKEPKRPSPPAPTAAPTQPTNRRVTAAVPLPSVPSDLGLGVAVDGGSGGTVTARRAGGLRDLSLQVDPDIIGVKGALQHLAKAVNIAFQTDYGENYLESVYQAAVVRNGEINIIHKDYFGFRDTWFGQFGRLLRSMQLTLDGPDPVSPEGQKRIAEKGPATIRGLLSLLGRKLDLVAEYEDRVPAYVEQMFDRLEASGIIEGWDRDDWEIRTTRVGLDIRISPRTAKA